MARVSMDLMNPAPNSSNMIAEPSATVHAGEQIAPLAAPAAGQPTEKPVVIIEGGKAGISLQLGDLWAYRELLYFLTWRDVKVRYKQTMLGVAWAILQPLLMMVIFSLVFGRVAGMPSDGIPYPLFAYGGLLAWTFFATAITSSGNSLVGSANLITKVYFPRMIIPGAAVCAAVVDLLFAFAVLVPLMIYYRIPVQAHLAVLPLLILLLMTLAVGVGMWLSALNVKYRDVRFALPFLTQIWMFLSPVIYPLNSLPPSLRLVMMANPITGIVEGFRSALFGLRFNWLALSISTLVTVVFLFYAVFAFKRMERQFADIV
jgi:lipopolysaccharide transport system permease protein